ncbi:hypothetical protein J4573_09875, partial [Actinomadura barringtoniae]
MKKSELPEALEGNVTLAGQVVDAAQREMADKARLRVPAIRMGALAGVLGACATAASYRTSVLMLEKHLPPEIASFVAAIAYGGGAGCAALVASRKWKGLPAPLPTETAGKVVSVLADKAG